MKDFIIYDRGENLYRMSFLEKNIPILILFIILALIYFFRKHIRENIKLEKSIRLTMLFINAFVTISYHIGRWIYIGVRTDNIPLHLCYICNIFSIIMLINKNEKIHKFLLFAGIIGGISSLISVDVTLSSNYLKYYYFMIAHISIIIVPIYFSIVHKYKLTTKNIITSFLYVQALGILMGIINYFFKSNYFFVSFNSNIAAKGTILEELGNGYDYFINLEKLAFYYFLLWIGIFKISQYTKKRKVDKSRHLVA